MFGVDLTTRVKAEDSAIPTLLQSCIEHIESTGMRERGRGREGGREGATGSIVCMYMYMLVHIGYSIHGKC